MVRNKSIQIIRKSQLGQSTVEYIMLMAVMTTIAISILKSDSFQDIFGENSEFFGKLAKMVEFSYRHGHMGTAAQRDGDTYNYGGNSVTHSSYIQVDGEPRFFLSLQGYPGN